MALSAAMLFSLVPAVQAEGGQPSVRNLAAGLNYTWSEQPEAQYPDTNPDGSQKLTDGKYGALHYSDPAWVGQLKKKTREVVFDLGEKKSISNIKAHFMQDWPNAAILVPLSVSMYVSDDNTNWGALSHNATQLLWGDSPTPREETFEWDGNRDGIKSVGPDAKIAYARYVKVVFPMHGRAWSFIDEIEILGTDGQAEGAVTVPADPVGFLQPGEATGGIRNLGLLYNGQYANGLGDWTKERIIPNISYVNQAGEPADWLFDGVLYLGLAAPNGRVFDGGADPGAGARMDEWNWYLDKTLGATGDMQQLNEATKEVGTKLGQPDYKEKVVLMIPNPGEYLRDFGVVDGEALNFNAGDVGEEKALANREKAIQWWLDQVQARWTAAAYSNLELVGMYWLEEQISTSQNGPELIRLSSQLVHDKGLKFFWIPHSVAYKSYMWKDVGFDAVALQPNYFFDQMSYDRLEDAANTAKRFGMSNELEFDDRMLTDGTFRERYVDYLNSGVETGLMLEGFKAYYQGNNAVYNSAKSTSPSTRILYDWLYQFVKGTYEKNNAAPPDVEVQMNGTPLQSEIVVLDTETVHFTWNIKNDDGSGLATATATFDGKSYAAGTPLPLAGKLGKHELVVTVTAGKSKKTSFVIEAATNAEGMKALVQRFVGEQQFNNAEAPRALNNYLEMMGRYAGTDSSLFVKYLKGFNAKLDLVKEEQLISGSAYDALKAGVYYLMGNLARNKAVEASSIEGGIPNYAPEKAVDGFPASRWASEYTDNSWFLVDLGAPTEMDTVKIDWEYARAHTFQLLVSDDKQNWTSVVQENNGVITAHDGKDTIRFAPVKARYVKFQGIRRATEYGYSFYEFGVYNLSGAELAKTIDGVQVAADASEKEAAINGLLMNGKLANVNLRVLNPHGKLAYEGKTTVTETGSFQFNFAMKGGPKGTYTAYLTTDGMSEPLKVAFEYKKANNGNGNGGK